MKLDQKKVNYGSALLAFPGTLLTGGIIGGFTIERSTFLLEALLGSKRFEEIRPDFWGVAIISSIILPFGLPVIYHFASINSKRVKKYIIIALGFLAFWFWSLLVNLIICVTFLFFR